MPVLYRRSACPQEVLNNITLFEIEFEGIFSDLLPFNAPVDTGTQSFLKCITCMHAFPCNYVHSKLKGEHI